MQVVILCGGLGTRIRDVADDIPKPMIPIGNRPILWHIMKGYAHHGFNEFILCLGHKSNVIKRFFLEYQMAEADVTVDLASPNRLEVHAAEPQEDWRVTMAETGIESMTGCRIKRIEKYITGDTFCLTYGDGVADVDVQHLVDFHHRHGKIGTVTAVQAPGRFGEMEIEGSRVTDFKEKPMLNRINGGFFVFDRRIFSRLSTDPKLVFENAPLMRLADDGELMAYHHDGFWHPMDNSRDYKYLNDLWAAGNAPWRTWDTPRMRLVA